MKYIKNYDGDTVTVDIPGVHILIGKNMKIRVSGIDTPEIRTKNTCEKEKARAAKRLVQSILKNAKRIDLKNIKRGKYFRIVADVIADGKSIKDILLKNKLGHEYGGGKKIKKDWCK
ncbi:MAG: hypothetical protein Unbinned5081contig1003_17 [Prokaryotic dsDNA virus sp.]|nr:MAG: hypothetical protein Unbinned5081contig1003_17 [Prokaryotic dsDNA virus sp.]